MKKPTEETVIALMGKDITNIQVGIVAINQTLKEISGAYITTNDFAEHIKIDNDHEIRIRSLEQSMWKLAGVSSTISAVLTMGFAYVLKLI